jgi:hypothetical protein
MIRGTRLGVSEPMIRFFFFFFPFFILYFHHPHLKATDTQPGFPPTPSSHGHGGIVPDSSGEHPGGLVPGGGGGGGGGGKKPRGAVVPLGAFGRTMGSRVSVLRARILRTVTDEFNAWLFAAGEGAAAVGTAAFGDAAAALAREAELRRSAAEAVGHRGAEPASANPKPGRLRSATAISRAVGAGRAASRAEALHCGGALDYAPVYQVTNLLLFFIFLFFYLRFVDGPVADCRPKTSHTLYSVRSHLRRPRHIRAVQGTFGGGRSTRVCQIFFCCKTNINPVCSGMNRPTTGRTGPRRRASPRGRRPPRRALPTAAAATSRAWPASLSSRPGSCARRAS